MIPETVTLTGRRNTPFAEEYEFTDETGAAFDFTNATAAMQIRLFGDAPGAALASLLPVTVGTAEGVYMSDPANGKIAVLINESTLDALPAAATAGRADVFAYDLIITWSDGLQECLIEGQFILNPGVTR
jgi:hypothetical protein